MMPDTRNCPFCHAHWLRIDGPLYGFSCGTSIRMHQSQPIYELGSPQTYTAGSWSVMHHGHNCEQRQKKRLLAKALGRARSLQRLIDESGIIVPTAPAKVPTTRTGRALMRVREIPPGKLFYLYMMMSAPLAFKSEYMGNPCIVFPAQGTVQSLKGYEHILAEVLDRTDEIVMDRLMHSLVCSP